MGVINIVVSVILQLLLQLGSQRTSCSCWYMFSIQVCQYVCVSKILIYLLCTSFTVPLHPGVLTITLLEVFLSSATGNWYSDFCSSVFLIMSPVSATTTTAPVCSRVSPVSTAVTMASTSVGLAVSGKHWVDPERDSEGFCWPHHSGAVAITSVLNAFSGICQLWHGFSLGEFSLRVKPPTNSLCCMWVLTMV